MRLWPFRLKAAQQTPRKELGASGTINISGFLQSSEYVSELRGAAGLAAFDAMLRSDGSVQEALEHIISPIKNAAWSIESASDDPEHLEQAALCELAYFECLRQPWLQSLDEQLDYLVYGHALFEHTWQVVEKELAYADPDSGDEVTLPSRQFVVFANFAPRLQSTLWRWNEEQGQLVSVVQQTYKDGNLALIELPVEQLLLFTNKRRGNDYTGRSILRSAYKHWYLKDLLEKVEAVSLERWGVGLPVAYPPQSVGNDDAVLDRLEDMLANLRGGEASYLVSPGPKQNSQTDGYLFEILSPSGSAPDFTGPINRHRGDIKAAMLARFAELGHQTTGARATGDIQAVVWFAALHAVARYICDVHQTAIRRLVDANYANVTAYPSLVAHDIEVRNVAELAQAYSQLVASGAVIADRAFREAVRKAIDVPDEDEGDPKIEEANSPTPPPPEYPPPARQPEPPPQAK